MQPLEIPYIEWGYYYKRCTPHSFFAHVMESKLEQRVSTNFVQGDCTYYLLLLLVHQMPIVKVEVEVEVEYRRKTLGLPIEITNRVMSHHHCVPMVIGGIRA